MSIPFFFSPPRYVKSLPLQDSDKGISLLDLCGKLSIPCRATGGWIQRMVYLRFSDDKLLVYAEPRNGSVLIVLPFEQWDNRWQVALNIMAYLLHDLVARQSIAGQPWSRLDQQQPKL